MIIVNVVIIIIIITIFRHLTINIFKIIIKNIIIHTLIFVKEQVRFFKIIIIIIIIKTTTTDPQNRNTIISKK